MIKLGQDLGIMPDQRLKLGAGIFFFSKMVGCVLMPYQCIETNKDHSEVAGTIAVFFEENCHQFPLSWSLRSSCPEPRLIDSFTS